MASLSDYNALELPLQADSTVHKAPFSIARRISFFKNQNPDSRELQTKHPRQCNGFKSALKTENGKGTQGLLLHYEQSAIQAPASLLSGRAIGNWEETAPGLLEQS